MMIELNIKGRSSVFKGWKFALHFLDPIRIHIYRNQFFSFISSCKGNSIGSTATLSPIACGLRTDHTQVRKMCFPVLWR